MEVYHAKVSLQLCNSFGLRETLDGRKIISFCLQQATKRLGSGV
jgi:hypothetical protein